MGQVAQAFRLRREVCDELRNVEDCATDRAVFNGDPSWTLALPRRAPSGTIEYAHNSVDYTPRGDLSEPIQVLTHLAAS